MLLLGQRAIVTGASRGIGLAISQRLASFGCSITLVSRDENALRQSASLLPKTPGQKHDFVAFDIIDLVTGKNASGKEHLLNHISNSSILVNCAGIATHSMLARLSDEAVIQTIGVNLMAPILLCKNSVKPMMKFHKTSGKIPTILNVSSMLSCTDVNVGGTCPYSALKAGLLGLTKSLSKELNGKIRVNAILPALVPETDMGKTGLKSLPTVSLEEVVDTAERLILDDSFNGELIVADEKGFRPLQLAY